MAGGNPEEAFKAFLGPINRALGCLVPQRLSLPNRVRKWEVETVYSVVIGRGAPVPLKGASRMQFYAGQWFRIVETEPDDERGPYKVATVQYAYQYFTKDGKDLVTFHWTPEDDRAGMKTYPHLHIGSALLAKDGPIFAGRFHKKHIPTGRVSIEAAVRFGVEELDVKPLKEDWDTILRETEARFLTWKTR